MLISEPYLLSLRKSLMLFDCTVGECSELPILYSIVNYPRKTWRAKLVLSTGLIFFLSFFLFSFFLFFFSLSCVFALHGTVSFNILSVLLSPPL